MVKLSDENMWFSRPNRMMKRNKSSTLQRIIIICFVFPSISKKNVLYDCKENIFLFLCNLANKKKRCKKCGKNNITCSIFRDQEPEMCHSSFSRPRGKSIIRYDSQVLLVHRQLKEKMSVFSRGFSTFYPSSSRHHTFTLLNYHISWLTW